jgi:hypothetical protein
LGVGASIAKLIPPGHFLSFSSSSVHRTGCVRFDDANLFMVTFINGLSSLNRPKDTSLCLSSLNFKKKKHPVKEQAIFLNSFPKGSSYLR